jgi:hypothetical protein
MTRPSRRDDFELKKGPVACTPELAIRLSRAGKRRQKTNKNPVDQGLAVDGCLRMRTKIEHYMSESITN